MLFNKIIFGADHAGAVLKNSLVQLAHENGWDCVDFGAVDKDVSADYPDVIPPVVQEVLKSPQTCGVLVCGSGVGVSIGANRFPGIRAALCRDVLTTQLARQHNDANVLALGGRMTTPEVARLCFTEFLITPFEGERHQGRVQKLDQLYHAT